MLLLFDWLVPPLLRVVTKDCRQPVVMQEANLVSSLVRLLQSLLDPLLKPPPPPPPSTGAGARSGSKAAATPSMALSSDPPEVLAECCLVFALVWTLGGTVDVNGRKLFGNCLRGFLKGMNLVVP